MLSWKKPHPILDQIFQLDLRSLAVFRVGLGLLLILDIMNRFPNLISHYTDFGALPRKAILELGTLPHYISLHMISGHWSIMAALFGLSIAISLLLIAGYRTRLMTFLAWFLLISLHSRAPIVLQAGDVLLRLLLFWAFFLPIGARFSIDAALTKSNDHYQTNSINGAACAAYLLQVAFIYWFGIFLKSGDEWWPDLTAVYYALHLDQFTTSFGVWLRQFPDLLKTLTVQTLFIESFIPLLWFVPFKQNWCRSFAILILVAMHLGFAATMNIGLFPFIDIVALLPIIPSGFWKWGYRILATPRRLGLKIYYDGECGFCRRMVFIIRECLLLRSTPVEAATGEPAEILKRERSWVVLDQHGQAFTKTAAMAEVWSCSPLLWPFAWILRVKPIEIFSNKIYDFIARHRMDIGPPFARMMPAPEFIRCQPSLVSEIVVVCFFAYCVWWNVATTQMFDRIQIRPQFSWAGQFFRIDQKWGMFAPFPKKDTGWIVIPGTLMDGREVDVFNARIGKPSFEKPKHVADSYVSQRWRKYLMNLTEPSHDGYLLYFGQYICRTWNAKNHGPRRLKEFEVFYVRQFIKLNYEYGPVQKISRWRHFCFGNSQTKK